MDKKTAEKNKLSFECENLEGANLQGANLWGANLWDTNLRDTNLRGANLQGTNLRDADLWGANLQGANLRGANLRGADLQGANLRGANLRPGQLLGTCIGTVSDNLTQQLMLYDMYSIPNGKDLFKNWQATGDCPYNENNSWSREIPFFHECREIFDPDLDPWGS
jgi:hypothetical protein